MRKIAFLTVFAASAALPLATQAGDFATCTFGAVPQAVVVRPQFIVTRPQVLVAQPQVVVVQAQRQRPRRPQAKPSLVRRVLKRVF